MKFGSAVPNFTLRGGNLGLSPLQKNEKLPKLITFSLVGANPLPNVGEIRRVYAGNRSTEVVNIWCDSVGKLGIYRQKTAMGHFLPKFSESPSSETTGPIKQIKKKQKWYGHHLSSCKVWWRSAAAQRREKEKLGVSAFCLSRSGP